jgi:hypothetical protein
VAYDYKTCEDLPTEGIRYNGQVLVCLPAHEGFTGLGVRASLAKRKGSMGPGTADERFSAPLRSLSGPRLH